MSKMSLQITRNLTTTTCLMLRRLTKRSNPGLGHQMTAIEDAAEVIQSDPEGFGDLESDLLNAHKSHKQYELDVQKQNAKIKQFLVNRKYFSKDVLPNLLTYAEKEQIRYLHSSDKEEWTVDKLSESFPANSEIIRKILKAHWSPMSSKRILSHDSGVLKNWERFKNGEFKEKLSVELQEHLQKFVDRGPKDLQTLQDPSKSFVKKTWQKPKSNEFSSILLLRSRCDETNNKPALTAAGELQQNATVQTEKGIVNNADTDTYLLGRIQNKKLMRIQDLKDKHLVFNNEDTSLDQQATLELKTTSRTGIVQEKFKSTTTAGLDYTEKFTSNEVIISEEDSKRYGMSTAKSRIHIPRKLWRKGALYRTKDCYYDDDGEFLYRVPGMTY